MHDSAIESSARWYSSHVTVAATSITSGDAAAIPAHNINDCLSLNLLLATASCMDLRQAAHESSKQQSSRLRDPSSLYLNSSPAQPQPRSSPLPQSQWSQVPLPYRPKDWPDSTDHLKTTAPVPGHDWRLRPSISGNNLSGSAVPAPLRSRRRPLSFLDPTISSDSRSERHESDISLAYPQMNPYAYQHDQGQHRRAVSQPNSPPSFQQRFAEAEPPMLGIPRSPTYPPAGRRQRASPNGTSDAAFEDEEDFRLFANATAGLSPDTAFIDPLSPQASSGARGQVRSRFAPSHHEQEISPIADSPSTMQAFTHLAQMPRAGVQYSAAQRERLQASASGLDLWLHPPTTRTPAPRSAIYRVEEEGNDDDDDDDDLLPPDDELPNYAESQAQAHAGQRAEAARRAQELQRRWQARR